MNIRSGINWAKLTIALMLMCLLFGLSAMAQTNPNEPLDAEAAAALVDELKEALPDLIEDEAQITAITRKWDARQGLPGKTRAQILNLLFTDVKLVISDREMQNQIWESWKEVGVNTDSDNEEKPAPKPESKPNPNPGAEWKQPKFRFEVEFSDSTSTFKLNVEEISGLDTEAQSIEYRSGNSKDFSTLKMPGLTKYSDVTLKKGIFVKDNKFWDWYNQIKSKPSQYKGTVTIKLLDEEGQPTMVWTLKNAWWEKMETDGKSISSIVIKHERLTIKNPD